MDLSAMVLDEAPEPVWIVRKSFFYIFQILAVY